jgi:hypothetical protein
MAMCRQEADCVVVADLQIATVDQTEAETAIPKGAPYRSLQSKSSKRLIGLCWRKLPKVVGL